MKVWIINQYAIPPSMGGLVRHYYFSKYLKEKGHEVKIFTSSKIHNANINMISGKELFIEKEVDGVEYTFVRTSDYKGNKLGRIINMLQFPFRVWRVCKRFEKPDVIYTSSPSPLTAVAAVLLAKRLKVPKVVEIRDLWPESIVEYNNISKKNPVVIALYQLEKWLYKHADKLVFTMAGGKDYIKEKGWDEKIDLDKIEHVNNGVDLEEFEYNREHYCVQDEDLLNENIFKAVYTGSIRKVNALDNLVESAVLLKQKNSRVKFLVWGDGNEKEILQKKCKELKLDNVVFKERVERKYIPYILSKADINFVHGKHTDIMRFGSSPNKLFDYLAAGRPILCDINPAYDLIVEHGCGVSIEDDVPKRIVEVLCNLENQSMEVLNQYAKNAKELSKQYDYRKLTEKLEKILESVRMENEGTVIKAD